MSQNYLSEKIAQAISDIEANTLLNKNSDSIETIFAEITAERKRQDELHPWDNLKVIHLFPDDGAREHHLECVKKLQFINDDSEKHKIAFVDCLLDEEYHEIFAETDPVKQETEAIQLAALAIKFVQWSRSKRA